MRPLTIWPFPGKHLAKYHNKIKGVLVAEMNLGQMVYEVLRVSAGKFHVKGLFRIDGTPILPSLIISEAKNVL